MCPKRRFKVARHQRVTAVEVLYAGHLFNLGDALFSWRDRLILDVNEVVTTIRGPLRALAEARDELGEYLIEVLRLARLSADDQWGSRLVNEDVVHLVHDREGVATLHPRLQLGDHVVAQVVEAELVIRAIGDVRGVRLTAGDRAKAGGALLPTMEVCVEDVRGVMSDDAKREAEEGEERPHPLRVASR